MRDTKYRAHIKETGKVYEVLKLYLDLNSVVVKCDMGSTVYGIKEVDLLQYTGLKDKNGVEIYKGDIYRNPNGVISVIEWYGLDACYHANVKNRNVTPQPLLSEGGIMKGAIIGNKFENPDLLKVDPHDKERS